MRSCGRQTSTGQSLFVWSASGFDALRLTHEVLPSSHFACLLTADSRGVADAIILTLADHLLERGLAYFCAWGPDCRRVHDIVDQAIVLREIREGREYPVITTWHSDEPLHEAVWFLLNAAYPDDHLIPTCQTRLGIAVANDQWSNQMEQLFTAATGLLDTP